MLVWAQQLAGLNVATLTQKLGVKPERIMEWEVGGEALPTFRQAQQWAQHTHAPFGYLFLAQPPVDDLPIPDLRTVGDHGVRDIAMGRLAT